MLLNKTTVCCDVVDIRNKNYNKICKNKNDNEVSRLGPTADKAILGELRGE